MSRRPSYFDHIRANAARRWEQLEQDPELAGPWHQLFKQVQSPRHILSELLQNADDAGATEARVWVADGTFSFEHNGEDFTDEHFASLCRFGYSNKRALHTIGFRGIGFKSTFSLGDPVELFTPTLAVAFHRRRFTEPVWLENARETNGWTVIRVKIGDRHRQKEVENNLKEWMKSPLSLLFFRTVRRLQVGEKAVHWRSLGPGPLLESEWMLLNDESQDPYLLVRSSPEPFPDEPLTEIRQERMIAVEDETDFPPCKIELVMGAPGRLYVVLPTGVETELPFACNAPFIQDPARLKIKDPETSPTNRWLLERTGQVAASAMLKWLGATGLEVSERAPAYGLFPDVDRDDDSLEGVCGTVCEEAFGSALDEKDFLLTDDGRLVPEKQSVILADTLLDVWGAEETTKLLDGQARPPLCRHIDPAHRRKLVQWRLVDEITETNVLNTLQEKHLPRPGSWPQLLQLWTYLAPGLLHLRYFGKPEDVRIVPVHGKKVLYSASETVRLGEKRLLQSESDWELLAEHLLFLNQNWLRFLSEHRRLGGDKQSSENKAVEDATGVLEKIGLGGASDVDKVVNQVAVQFFAPGESLDIGTCVQLAQIAAKLNARLTEEFHFVTRDRKLRPAYENVVYDQDGTLENLLPVSARDAQLIHQHYSQTYVSCSPEEWRSWITSGRALLLTLPAINQVSREIRGREKIKQEARRRGYEGALSFHYVTHQFRAIDWDFNESYWQHWEELANSDEYVWVNLVERILTQPESYWSRALSARLLQVATTGSTRTLTADSIPATWIIRLQKLPCLPDTRGFAHRPGDLLMRTPETEALMDVELFVHGRLDREVTRPLLELLGVGSTPTGPEGLLSRLRALAQAENPPIREVERWCGRLDQLADNCSTAELSAIKEAFQTERLVLAQDGAWVTSLAVALPAENVEAPESLLINSTLSDLTLWRKVGVAERPTAELTIQWLMTLPSGLELSQKDAQRVRELTVRHPVRVWEECVHWINLANEWVPLQRLSYSLRMQHLIPWRHLHKWVKQKTADFQFLSAAVVDSSGFSNLTPLAHCIEERFEQEPDVAMVKPTRNWMRALGEELGRVELDDQEETVRVRRCADALARTKWVECPAIKIIPYIEGTPAGTPQQADVVWRDIALYTEPLSQAKLARRVPDVIGKVFGRTDIKAALDYGFERSIEDVRAYMEANFFLSPVSIACEPGQNGERTENSAEGDSLQYAMGQVDTPVASSPTNAEQVFATSNGVQADVVEVGEDESTDEPAIEEALEDEPALDEFGVSKSPPKTDRKPAQPDIVERFAKSLGFRKDSDARFYGEDGSWIARAKDALFPWVHHDACGELLKYYWAKDHCLERTPLEIKAEIWSLVEQHPDSYALILADTDGAPKELTGEHLRMMTNMGEVVLYPATYRVVLAGTG